ncbi:flagellar export chaperone FliS [Desulforhabdus amnigena]|jgi:flagellar protein FliS|uniref:Flagellar secretion chaperone FliS n=1 Tax=Desulforhabdus amnigena TaxID=40218 RepID=A0A9W6FS00_9BACT|nr:flagellar export chaperone FliS [Desulforhabdus amnigena]NLJ27080.1 flagellar export chaperone FliS [Deltaproteobacteria bacterium]GLI33529.1 hypothetical protein DAMNIGENAA_09620 [Desulforhabdus amnigena]
MTPYAHHAYQKTAVNAIYDKERLVVMVYEGLVGFLHQARDAMTAGNSARKGEAISSIIALLTELDCALDREAGGEMATNLADLYQWMMGRLTEANLHNDVHRLDEVEKVVVELKEGFEGAAKQLAAQAVQQPAAPAPVAGVVGTPVPTRRLSYAV